MLVAALAAAGCCPPLKPTLGDRAGPQIVPQTPGPPRNVPAPVVSRFQRPPPMKGEPVKREMITEPPRGLPGPKLEEVPVKREPLVPTKPPPPLGTLPDEILMRLLESGRAAFVRCFKKAVRADPTEVSFKVRVRVELDANAAITHARTDATNAVLDACLVRAVAWLKFPASGKRVAVELPLFYRAE